MLNKDQLFLDDKTAPKRFEFSKETVAVFDDMVTRSVPGYEQLQRLIAFIVEHGPVKDPVILDLGCSTGETIKQISEVSSKIVKFIGIDKSEDMLQEARVKCQNVSHVTFKQLDLNQEFDLGYPNVVILNLTLQFLRPERRSGLIQSIYNVLPTNGMLILVEKVQPLGECLENLFDNVYYTYKLSNGYSLKEIQGKRKALQNVLIPNTSEVNRNLIQSAGFLFQDVFYRWFNFEGRVAIK